MNDSIAVIQKYMELRNQVGAGGGVEFEAKFLDIDVDSMRKKVRKLGGTLIHDRKKYVRAAYDLCSDKVPGYARVRQEDKFVTMTVKTYENKDFPKEFEVTIKEDFATGREFMEALGLREKAFQESYREKWGMPNHPDVTEITFDDLPGIPTYIEVDCKTEEALNMMIRELDLDTSKKRFGAFDRTYEEYYGIERIIINTRTPSLTFKNVKNELDIKKNNELFNKVAERQRDW